MQNVTAERRLWETGDRKKIVEEGDPEAAFLFCAPGQTLAAERAKRYGDFVAASKPKKADAKKAEPGEDKKSEPGDDKAQREHEDKARR